MPESANRANGIVYSTTMPFTVEEYIKTLLETGTSVDVIENFLKNKKEELKNKLDELRNNNSSEEEIKKIKAEYDRITKIIENVTKKAQIRQKETELKENIEKTKKCYEDTLACADRIFAFISNLNIKKIGNITEKKFQLDTLMEGDGKEEVGYKNLMNSQIIFNNKTIEILEDIRNLKVDYKTYEAYKKMAPVFEGKTREEVKNKYKEIILKIMELEEKKQNSTLLAEKIECDKLIVSLKLVIDKVLPTLLQNPKQITAIREEVLRETNSNYNPILINDEIIDTEEQEDVTTNDSPIIGNIPKKQPITSPKEEKFQKAKEEYLSVIKLINTAIGYINALNREQDLFAMNPEFNYERIIAKETEAAGVCNRITELKQKLLDLEYDFYINDHILLNLDPEINAIKIENAEYNTDLEMFISLHNEVIEGCYKELHQIFGQEDYATREDLKARSSLLLKVIDSQHMIINRRLLTERRKNKKFDMISFMRAHRVEPKKFNNDPIVRINSETPYIPAEMNEEKENMIIKKIEEQLLLYKNSLIEALSHKYIADITPSTESFNEFEQLDIIKKFKTADEKIAKYIDETELSFEKKRQMHEKAETFKKEITEEFFKKVENDKEYYEMRKEYKKDMEALMAQSNELIDLSSTTISSEKYKAKKTIFHNSAKLLKEKYKDLDIQIIKDKLTERLVISIFDKYQNERVYQVLRVMSAEKEKTLGTINNTKIKPINLNFGGKIQHTERTNALIATTEKIKLSLLKNSIKVEYTKDLLEELKSMKVKIEIAVANGDGKIFVTESKESKDGQKEYRYIKNPDELTEAKLVYKDEETDEEIMSYDILQNNKFNQVIEERRKFKR